LKFPAGALIGSLVAVAILNVFTGNANFPKEVKIISQSLAGAYIGSTITRADILEVRQILKPAIFLVVTMSLFNIVSSAFLSNFTEIDLITALFATAPGGLMDMILLAADMGANTSAVASVQLLRIIAVVSFTPMMLKFCIAKFEKKSSPSISVSQGEHQPAYRRNLVRKGDMKNMILTLMVGVFAGLVGYMSGVPAGTMTFSMLAVAILNVTTYKGYMPIKLRRLAQVLAGALIGIKFTLQDVLLIQSSFWPIFVVILSYLCLNIVLGVSMYKFSGIALPTSLFATSAGGLSEMTMIAHEMGGDTSKVVVLQLARVVSVVAFYPTIIHLISRYF
jgi:membrane AbrB-like protein